MRGEDTMSSGSIVEVVIDPVDNELSSASRKGAHTRDDRLPLSGVPVPDGMGYASESAPGLPSDLPRGFMAHFLSLMVFFVTVGLTFG